MKKLLLISLFIALRTEAFLCSSGPSLEPVNEKILELSVEKDQAIDFLQGWSSLIKDFVNQSAPLAIEEPLQVSLSQVPLFVQELQISELSLSTLNIRKEENHPKHFSIEACLKKIAFRGSISFPLSESTPFTGAIDLSQNSDFCLRGKSLKFNFKENASRVFENTPNLSLSLPHETKLNIEFPKNLKNTPLYLRRLSLTLSRDLKWQKMLTKSLVEAFEASLANLKSFLPLNQNFSLDFTKASLFSAFNEEFPKTENMTLKSISINHFGIHAVLNICERQKDAL